MSGWTLGTFRAVRNEDCSATEYDGEERLHPGKILGKMMDGDARISNWTYWKGHVYVHFNCGRYDFAFAEEVMKDYSELIDDAVILGANDTSGYGTARYYDRPDLGQWTDQYEESYNHSPDEQGMEGAVAMRVMTARHGIVPRDPFNNEDSVGWRDEHILDGEDRRGELFGTYDPDEFDEWDGGPAPLIIVDEFGRKVVDMSMVFESEVEYHLDALEENNDMPEGFPVATTPESYDEVVGE